MNSENIIPSVQSIKLELAVCSSKMLFSLVLALSLFCVATTRPTVLPTLSVAHLDDRYVEARYFDGLVTVSFVSTPTTLTIRDNNGRILVSAEQFLNDMIVAIIADNGFVQLNGKGYHVSKVLALEIRYGGLLKDPRVLELMLQNIKAKQIETQERLRFAVETLMTTYEMNLLRNVSFALAKRGVNGYGAPSIMPFYKFSLQMEKLKDRKLMSKVYYMTLNYRNMTGGDDDDDCLEYCPPCPELECIGMCGYGCNCWKFICGDCCMHTGCYDHDVCCRENFFDISCLFPFDFSCEEHYYC